MVRRKNTSSERGESFERRVFNELKEALESGRLGLLPEACTIHHRKGYYSHDRGSEIVVDISIEMRLPGADTWSLLWIWECKDHSSNIPVSDVQNFWAVLQQIAPANGKGGIATTSPLQKSALSYADKKGLAVVRFLPDDKVSWSKSHPVRRDPDSIPLETKLRWFLEENRMCQEALIDSDFIGSDRNFYALFGGVGYSSFGSLLRDQIKSDVTTHCLPKDIERET